MLANSSLMKTGMAERGVLADTAERAESSEGNVAVTGVVRPSLGRGPGMMGEGVWLAGVAVLPSSQANDSRSRAGEGVAVVILKSRSEEDVVVGWQR